MYVLSKKCFNVTPECAFRYQCLRFPWYFSCFNQFTFVISSREHFWIYHYRVIRISHELQKVRKTRLIIDVECCVSGVNSQYFYSPDRILDIGQDSRRVLFLNNVFVRVNVVPSWFNGLPRRLNHHNGFNTNECVSSKHILVGFVNTAFYSKIIIIDRRNFFKNR